MRVLLVHPRFPITYWGFQYALRVIGKKASLPPLGLVTLAASLPTDWELRLIDLNVRPLGDRDLEWAQVVLTGGMLVQSESALEVVRRARGAGRYVAVGGPAPTTSPDLFSEADLVFRGEAEGRVDALVDALQGRKRMVLEPVDGEYPDVTTSPVPRFDLLELDAYASMSIQYSRGCPYRCEFCDVIEIFGRRPRVKTPAQMEQELEALHHLGYRGSIFFVDDNFIGNRPAVRELLPRLSEWQVARGRPFELYTEASVNLATDRELTAAMVDAGFGAVFLGIETPSVETLRAAGKHQNVKLDLTEALETLTRAGLETMGGFIVGFDHDDTDCFEAQRRFIQSAPMPFAMVGMLTALPGTALWKRLSSEGRLRERASGDQFARPNFEPAMDERELLEGYAELMNALYSPARYYERCEHYLDLVGARPGATDGSRELDAGRRATWQLGVVGRDRRSFWRLLRHGARRGMPGLRWAIAHAVQGEHLIRYTQRHVVPRARAAAAALPPRASGTPLRPPARLRLPVAGQVAPVG